MKRFDKFRGAGRAAYDGLFSARALCAAGLLVMPSLLFNPVTGGRILQFFFFWFLALLSGKKNNPLFTFLVILGIAAFNLIVPYGRVLFSIGAFKITSGALLGGINRAVTLEGLVMLSRAAIRRDLNFPGMFGEITGESFRLFAFITGSKHRITRKNFMNDLDILMLEIDGPERRPPSFEGGTVLSAKTRPAGFLILAAAVIVSWLPWLLILLGPSAG